MQQLGLFDVPSEQDGPQTFTELAQEYQNRLALAATEVERDAYQNLLWCAACPYPVNAVARKMYLATKITYRYYGELRPQLAIYLQEFPCFLAGQQSDPHTLTTAATLEEAFAAPQHKGTFQYRDDGPVLVWRNNEDEPFVMTHLNSDSHTVVSSLDELEIDGEWIVC